MLELEYVSCDLEVGVVVHDRHLVLSCQYGGHEIGDAYRSMPPGSSQGALRVECTLPVTVVGRQVLVGLAAVGAHLLVLRRAAGAVERLGIKGGAGGHQAPGDEWLQPLRDGGQPHPGRRAGVDEEPGGHRHTSARCLGSAIVSSPPSRSQATCRARAAALAACRNAARTVSDTPVVLSSRCARASSSSSRSIRRFVTGGSLRGVYIKTGESIDRWCVGQLSP